MEELIVLLDEQHNPIGNAPKLASHHADTPLHLAFSCYIFDDSGKFLLTRRAASKKVWPEVWTNSVCGHPLPGEPMIDAIRRRALFELGIAELDDIQEILPEYSYRTPPFHGIIENEFCPVFAARLNSPLQPNPDEVQDFRWISWPGLPARIAEEPDAYSYWLKDQLKQLSETNLADKYAA